MITTIPRICASIAAKPSALGVVIHDAAYRATGLDFKYLAIGSTDLKPAVDALRALNARGFAISMPHKVSIIPMLDEVSDSVKAIGACNTVVNDAGVLRGHNTDWRGGIDALEAAEIVPPGKALVVGSGGVARALTYGLKHRGWMVEIAARNSDTAQELAQRFDLPRALPLGVPPYLGVDLVVNATPCGDYPNGALDLEWFPDARALLDVVFIPVRTPLSDAAAERGWRVVPGWGMLLCQAAYQFQLYMNMEAPLRAMEEALLSALGKK